MIRADSTLANARMAQSFHKTNKTIARQNGALLLAERRGEGNRRAVWGDRTRGHLALNSSQDWPGPPHDAGRTCLGPSQYIGSHERRDSSTTVSINALLFPQAFFQSSHEGCHFALTLNAWP